MQVTIKYNDASALLLAEVVRNAKHAFGENTQVRIAPDSGNPEDVIYFGIQQLITSDHLSLLYDSIAYNKELPKFRASIITKLGEILDQVLIDNETKVS